MDNKLYKLFLDFDNTIVNATKSFCNEYNNLYQNHLKFTPARWELVDRYDFKDQCPLVEKVEDIFKMKSFFENLEFINENTYQILQSLNEFYQIIIVSIGTYENISLKSLWIRDNLPFIKDSIFLVNNGCKMDKSLIDMRNAVFIDDVASNLNSSNATFKRCFGEKHQWNLDWTGKHYLNWSNIAYELLYLN